MMKYPTGAISQSRRNEKNAPCPNPRPIRPATMIENTMFTIGTSTSSPHHAENPAIFTWMNQLTTGMNARMPSYAALLNTRHIATASST